MSIAMWIINIITALVFLAAGAMKVARPKAKIVESGMGWAADMSSGAVKAIGALEVIGAIGLFLPIATGIAPVLTPIAAVGLAIIMVGAVVVHARRKESFAPAAILLVLSIVSAVVAFMAI